MIDKTIFLLFAISYFYTYGPHPLLVNFLLTLYHFYDEYFTIYNRLIYPTYWDDNFDKEITQNENEIKNETPKEQPKYEDKYLEDIRKLSKDWILTEEENNELPSIINDFYNQYIETRQNRIKEITGEIINLEKDILQDRETECYVEIEDEDGDRVMDEYTLEERNNDRRDKIKELQEEASKIIKEIETEQGINELKTQSEIQAKQYIINKRLDKLKNCYVIEKTPIGNVLMIYEKDRESFKYYSDCNIPYRYLEVVGRKYVKLFGCRPIFIDMEEELRLFEEKWDKEQELKKIKEEEDRKKVEEASKSQKIEPKKNVFAKFKSYNKDAGGKISMAAPPKNSIPNKSVGENKDNDRILLKERANRYTYEGKFANFNFLQKIDRKVFNKKLGLSFADFKKMKK